MEWNCVFKRYLTSEEKEILNSIIEKHTDKIERDRQNIPKIWKRSINEEDVKFIETLFKEILYDFVYFDFFVMSDTPYDKELSSIRMSKKWSRMFTGCCYVPIKDLMEDTILLYTDCSDTELTSHIINKTPEISGHIQSYGFEQFRKQCLDN
jgi:hypothetical protein